MDPGKQAQEKYSVALKWNDQQKDFCRHAGLWTRKHYHAYQDFTVILRSLVSQ